MQFPRSLAAALAPAALALALPASASTIVPPAPQPFELVNLRMNVDSCAFNPSSVFVTTQPSAIQVRLRDNQCFAAGTPRDVDIRLGEFPVGTYAVEVASLNGDIVTIRERLTFTVPPRAEIAIFPPLVHPLTDYSGLWYDPRQPGWGLSIHQNPADGLFAALFEYTTGAPGSPKWSTYQSGRWTSFTAWQGTIYRTTSPPLTVEAIGTVILDFDVAAPTDAPPGLKWARVTVQPASSGSFDLYVTRQPF